MKFRFGGYQTAASVHTRAAAAFGAALKRRLGDEAAFELIGNVLELGRDSAALPPMVAGGELEFCYISSVQFSRAVPELQLLELPFVIRDRPTILEALAGPLGERLARGIEAATPFRVLGFWDNGFRHVSAIRPLRTPADCRGLTIRTQVSDLHVACFRLLGFEPLPVDVKVFVEEIATGKYQAQDNPLTNTYNFDVHRYQPYITLSGHLWGAAVFVCAQSAYATWPAEVRAAVDAAAREANAEQHRLAAAEDAEVSAKFPPGTELITLSDDEHRAFVAAVQPLLDRYRERLGADLFEYLA